MIQKLVQRLVVADVSHGDKKELDMHVKVLLELFNGEVEELHLGQLLEITAKNKIEKKEDLLFKVLLLAS